MNWTCGICNKVTTSPRHATPSGKAQCEQCQLKKIAEAEKEAKVGKKKKV